MHYHCEIIFPNFESDPAASVEDEIEAKITTILAPFDESPEPEEHDGEWMCELDDDGEVVSKWPYAYKAFWDYWVIGGRWSGTKLQKSLDQDKYQAFLDELNKREFTVSGIQMGKQELEPSSQIPVVDALWREWFPASGIERCPLFRHAGDQMPLDIATLGETPKELSACRVIIANAEGRALYMVEDSMFNGVTFQKAAWSGRVWDAIEDWKESVTNEDAEFRAARIPDDDWFCVTVDYHS